VALAPFPGVGELADWGVAGRDWWRFAREPSWARAGEAGLSTGGAVVPGLSAVGAKATFPALAGMLLDPKQLERARGLIDAVYPEWGATDFVRGRKLREVGILKNPSQDELGRLRAKGDVRVLMNKDKTELFAWPAEKALHPEVADDVGYKRTQDPKTGIWTNDYLQGIIPRQP
jgi:hypothetical protein